MNCHMLYDENIISEINSFNNNNKINKFFFLLIFLFHAHSLTNQIQYDKFVTDYK